MSALYYEGVNPTVDLVILNQDNKVLLIKRKDTVQACPSLWALPGGFIDSLPCVMDNNIKVFVSGAETAKEAAIREVKEETNLSLKDISISLVGIYEGNGRDPRDSESSWAQSHAFFYQIPEDIFQAQKNEIRGLDDAEDVDWVDIATIKNMKLAFDHNVIIKDALNLYVNKPLIEHSPT